MNGAFAGTERQRRYVQVLMGKLGGDAREEFRSRVVFATSKQQVSEAIARALAVIEVAERKNPSPQNTAEGSCGSNPRLAHHYVLGNQRTRTGVCRGCGHKRVFKPGRGIDIRQVKVEKAWQRTGFRSGWLTGRENYG